MEERNIPGYEMIQRIGEGRWGSVWLAKQQNPPAVVALKFVRRNLFENSDQIELFIADVFAVTSLEHAGIVKVYWAGIHEDTIYYASEFVPGCTLRELMDRKGLLTEKNALAIALGCARALSYAWDKHHIAHTHIEPENVMIERNGDVKIIDLGLTRLVTLGIGKTLESKIHQKLPFAAPEQIGGHTQLDYRTDIYSLGMTLYNMVTGLRPSYGARPAKDGYHLDYVPDIREVNPELSDGLASLVEKWLVRDRLLRPQIWAEVLDDLNRVLKDELPTNTPVNRGLSTMLRTVKPVVRMSVEKKKGITQRIKALTTQAVEKHQQKKIVLSTAAASRMAKAGAPARRASRNAMFPVMLAVTLAVLGYLGYKKYGTMTPSDTGKENEIKEMVGGLNVETRDGKLVISGKQMPTSTEAAAPVFSAPAGKPVTWNDPAFLEGASLFNDALEKYTAYAKTKANPGVLPTVEETARKAAGLFESCKDRAPADVDIADYIQQCYHLISDSRLSSVADGRPAGTTTGKLSSYATSLTNRSQTAIQLSANWKTPPVGGAELRKDLVSLLSGQVTPIVDLNADSSVFLYDRIYFSMPVADAARIMNLTLPPKQMVTSVVFPRNSFFVYTFRADFGEGYSKMLVVADTKDQIVALQLANEHPDENLLNDAASFSDAWRAYNFVEGKTRPAADWKSAHRVTLTDPILRIDSELVRGDPQSYFGVGKPKERIALIMPTRIASLLLYYLTGGIADHNRP